MRCTFDFAQRSRETDSAISLCNRQPKQSMRSWKRTWRTKWDTPRLVLVTRTTFHRDWLLETELMSSMTRRDLRTWGVRPAPLSSRSSNPSWSYLPSPSSPASSSGSSTYLSLRFPFRFAAADAAAALAARGIPVPFVWWSELLSRG